mmetsp:Transcript_354/g.942  ORF Transcript_354/g.942 Transcript_354/m.942 type:complete len:223 (-) Transcript_354:430-1098(-)
MGRHGGPRDPGRRDQLRSQCHVDEAARRGAQGQPRRLGHPGGRVEPAGELAAPRLPGGPGGGGAERSALRQLAGQADAARAQGAGARGGVAGGGAHRAAIGRENIRGRVGHTCPHLRATGTRGGRRDSASGVGKSVGKSGWAPRLERSRRQGAGAAACCGGPAACLLSRCCGVPPLRDQESTGLIRRSLVFKWIDPRLATHAAPRVPDNALLRRSTLLPRRR